MIGSGLNHQILRRTTGTWFQKHGEIKDTQALLRHTKASTTLEHYQKKIPESLVQAVDSWYDTLMKKKPVKKPPGKVVEIGQRQRKVR